MSWGNRTPGPRMKSSVPSGAPSSWSNEGTLEKVKAGDLICVPATLGSMPWLGVVRRTRDGWAAIYCRGADPVTACEGAESAADALEALCAAERKGR